MSKTALVPIAGGTEELEAVCIIDTLRRAGAQVTVASVSGTLQVTASRGVRIVADKLIGDCMAASYDLIALPGGMPGAEHLLDCADLIEMLKKQKQAGRFYGAICASPAVVLAHHGLLDGVKATCYPSLQDKLDTPTCSNDNVVVDHGCITSQGPGTALEFSLKLVEVLFGLEKRREVATAMLTQ